LRLHQLFNIYEHLGSNANPCVQFRLYPVVALVSNIIVILSGANMFFIRGKNDL